MKKIYSVIILTVTSIACFGQTGSELDSFDSDLSSAKGSVLLIAKGLCGIGAAIGFFNIARKGVMEDGHTAGELMKWLLLMTIGAGGFTALVTVF